MSFKWKHTLVSNQYATAKNVTGTQKQCRGPTYGLCMRSFHIPGTQKQYRGPTKWLWKTSTTRGLEVELVCTERLL